MRLRSAVIVFVALGVIAVIGLLIISGRLDSFRPRIQAELQQKLNRSVVLGKLSLRLLPLEIKVDGLTIGESPSFPNSRPFATASTVFVSAGIFSLLNGSPEIKSVVLEKPQIELIRNGAGVWNFSSLGKSSGGGGESDFSLDSLKVSDGQVGFTDQLNNEPRGVYDHIDLHLSDFAPRKQFGLELGVHFPGDGQQTLDFDGKIGPLNVANENSLPPVKGHLKIQQVSLAGMNRLSPGTVPANTDSVITGEADVSSLADVLSLKGDLRLENTTLRGAKLDYTITAKYNVEDDFKQKRLLIREGNLQLGSTSFTASGSIDAARKPALLNVQLKTTNTSITELAKLTGALGLAFNPNYKLAGKLNADVSARGPSTSPQLSGTVSLRGLEASGGEIKEPVSVPAIDLTLSPETVMSNTFTARSGATSLAIAFSLTQYTTKNMGVDATIKTDGANVAELLNIAKTYGVEAAEGVTGTGKLSLDLHVKGPVSNASQLAYAGTASIMNTTVSTPTLRKPVTITSANATFSQNSVGFSNLVATLAGTTVHGSLSAKDFAAPQLNFGLAVDRIDTNELQNLTVAPAKDTKKEKPTGPSLLELATGSGNVSIGILKANDIELKDVSAKCQLDKGLIQLSPLSASIFGGKTTGSLSADMRPATTQLTMKMKFAGVDANNLLSSVSSVKNTVYGTLAADTNIRFALVPSNDLPRTLNGTISFDLANGLIKNLNIINEVEKVGKFLKQGGPDTTTPGGTALKKFSGTLNILNGVASTDNLVGVLNAAALSSKGSLNLVNQDVNMHVTAVLTNTVSQSVGGTGIGGFLSTALSNNKGELVVPVMVTGNMSHPVVTPDIDSIAKMKLGNLLPSTGDPSKPNAGILGQKGLGGVLNGILGGQPQSSGKAGTKQQQPQQDNPINSILDQFKKKKQPQ